MRVQLHNALRSPADVQATRVLVCDSYGNPLMIAVEEDNNVLSFACLGQPDFELLLRTHGITKTTLITDVHGKSLSELLGTR